MAKERFIHNYDIVFCEKGGNNHRGPNPTFDVKDDQVYAEGGTPRQYRIVTDVDLLKTTLLGCPDGTGRGKATSIASILEGKAEEVRIHGKVPLLVNLIAVEKGTGHLIRVARTYAERMAAHEGAKKHVYPDSANPPNPTVGIGFNMKKDGAKDEFDRLLGLPPESTTFDDVYNGRADLTQDQMVTLLEDGQSGFEDMGRQDFTTFDNQEPERKAVLTELEANMGSGVDNHGNPVGVRQFTNMRADVDKGEYDKASYEVLHGSHGGPSLLVGQVHEGRANNYAASLRWNVFGKPEEEASPKPADGNDVPVNPDFDPSEVT